MRDFSKIYLGNPNRKYICTETYLKIDILYFAKRIYVRYLFFSGERERVLLLSRAVRGAGDANGMSRRPMHLSVRENTGDAAGRRNNLRW